MNSHAPSRVALPCLLAVFLTTVFLTAAFFTPAAQAAPAPPLRTEFSWCGSGDEVNHAVEIVEHVARERWRERERQAGRVMRQASVSTVGNIAVFEDNGSMVTSFHPFDLADNAVEYRRQGSGMLAVASAVGIDANLGEPLELADDDTTEVALPKRFRFRFYGKPYSSIHVNSDGNLTFGQGDARLSRRLSDMITGPPRVAALFADLDPSAARGDGGVYLRVLSNKVQITWWRVPQYGTNNENTVQVTLARNGKVTVAYGQIAAQDSVIGAAPGRGELIEILDYSDELPFGSDQTGLVERFSTQQNIDNLAMSNTFLEHFRDQYEHLVVFLDFPQQLILGAFAYETGITNTIEGIGLNPFDFGPLYGSDGTLESFVQMGWIGNYPNNPSQTVFGHFTALDVFAHEVGHRWLSRARFDRGSGQNDELLGFQRTHWNFFMDTDGSVMQGNDLRDNGNGTFQTVGAVDRFSQLDLYLMGLASAEEVPPFFYVANGQGASRDAAPQVGVQLRGNRVDLTMAEVIAGNGPRRPSFAESPKSWKVGFVILGRQGEPPSASSIALVDVYRERFISFFHQLTQGRGSLDTTLVAK